MWIECINQGAHREFAVSFTNGKYMRLTAWVSNIPAIETAYETSSAASPNGMYNLGTKYHVAYQWDASHIYAWGNAVLPNTLSSQPQSSGLNLPIAAAVIGANFDGAAPTTAKIDELRLYNKKIDITELVNNDFNGLGGNPTITEHLFAWYQFEKFETLDFSSLQDGTDLRIGIRDMSGNLNHAFNVGYDSNPASPTYVLKSF